MEGNQGQPILRMTCTALMRFNPASSNAAYSWHIHTPTAAEWHLVTLRFGSDVKLRGVTSKSFIHMCSLLNFCMCACMSMSKYIHFLPTYTQKKKKIYHRMAWVERHLKDLLVPTPPPWAGMSPTGSIYRCILYCSRAMARFYFLS